MESNSEDDIFNMCAINGIDLNGNGFPDRFVVDLDTLERPAGDYFGAIVLEYCFTARTPRMCTQ